MRVQPEQRMRPHARRRNVVIVALVVALIILLLVVQGLAGFYANFLWFHWNGLGSVWSQVTATKVVLAVVFVVIAWALLWMSLFVVDTVAPRAMFLAPDNELVRRYQATVGPYALIVRSAVSFVIALILGIGASGQWQHWILFENALPFGRLDPLFHRDVSFFIFRLPFLSFLVDWIFTALVVTFIVTVIAYFLNGAIQFRRSARVEPRAIAHLSLILALIVLERAWAYYYVDRYGLDLSSSGVVHGASYTDVHVRLAALTLLAVVSLVAFVAFSVNIYERSLALPAIAFGLWVFLALVVGVIYPAIFQALRVTPAQSTLELPYIKDNIAATRYAMGIDNVDRHTFPANEDLTPAVLTQYQKTLSDVLLWDPSVAVPTFQRLQVIKSYYQLSTLAVDRYEIDGKTTPVVVGVRSLNPGGLAQQSWVNTHLQYTHGYGVVAAAANVANSSNLPNFLAGNIPTSSSSPALSLSRPAVYYAPGDSQYAIVDTKQPEVQYQAANGTNVEGHCHGCGGIPIGGFFNRLTFAIHLRDLNLLISNLVTGQSRLIYIPDIEARVQKALPFLQVDSHPYPVVVDGEIDWVVDAYTTSAYFPYGQPAVTSELPSKSGLAGRYNYVRDAVKVVVNAYTGKMSFYVIAPSDPLIRAYERAFPGLFQPLKDMNPVLRGHLRYPQDLLMVQADMYGRYHIESPSGFYSLSDAWDLSQTSNSASGSPSNQLARSANGSIARYTPVYELLQLPGDSSLSFDAIEPLVPFSSNDNLQTLRALFVADSNANGYGKLDAFVTPGESIHGPALANADINANPTISKAITLLDSRGSTVSLGTVQILPIADSLVYVRPLYVSSSQTPFPQLVDVVVVYGKDVSMESTLGGALAGIFGSAPASTGPQGKGTGAKSSLSQVARQDIAQAVSAYQAAQAALARGDLGSYQQDVTRAGTLLGEANALVNANPAPSTTTTTVPRARSRARAALSSAA
ncbi:MAG: UPF0182 family protein [Acidimicrobiales bacterium]